MPLKTYKDLDVCKLEIQLFRNAYIMIKNFSRNTKYGLVSQISKNEIKMGKVRGSGCVVAPYTHLPFYPSTFPHSELAALP